MRRTILLCLIILTGAFAHAQTPRKTEDFDANWKFFLGDDADAKDANFDDSKWRKLNLPHDWSIEGNFDEKNPSTQAEGGLPAGIGWYRKTFTVPALSKGKNVFIDFDGVYRN